jgi:hypothetical protein
MVLAVPLSREKGVSMNDPSTLWLTVTNIALGAVTLICMVAVGIGVVQELAARAKKRAAFSKLDKEVSDLVASLSDGHAFDTPSLGLTMADGGEELRKKEER